MSYYVYLCVARCCIAYTPDHEVTKTMDVWHIAWRASLAICAKFAAKSVQRFWQCIHILFTDEWLGSLDAFGQYSDDALYKLTLTLHYI